MTIPHSKPANQNTGVLGRWGLAIVVSELPEKQKDCFRSAKSEAFGHVLLDRCAASLNSGDVFLLVCCICALLRIPDKKKKKKKGSLARLHLKTNAPKTRISLVSLGQN